MARNLVFFSSPLAGPPTFVIPVFGIPGSNMNCVQDLSLDGRVKSFHQFDAELFFPVPVFPPAISIEVGDDGLLAFWKDESTVWIGSAYQIKSNMNNLADSDLPPFIAVEVSTFVGDESRLESATQRAAVQLSNLEYRDVFISSTIKRAKFISSLIEEQSSKSNVDPEESLEGLLDKLRSDLTDNNWAKLWCRAWGQFDKQILADILRWKISFRFGQEGQKECVETIAFSSGSIGRDLVVQWLSDNLDIRYGWPSIWLRTYSYSSKILDNLQRVGLKYLDIRADGGDRYSIDHQWCMLWSRLWREGADRPELETVALRALRTPMVHADSFVRMVLKPLRLSIGETEEITEYLSRWLSSPHVYRVWVETFIEMNGELGEVSKIRSAGIEWLRRLGGGMNMWEKLWDLLKRSLSKSESISLAEDWLVRSRKDLTSWPSVFSKTLQELDQSPSPKLVSAAKAWIEEGSRAGRSNDLIEAVASGTFPTLGGRPKER